LGVREMWKGFRPLPADILERLERLSSVFREMGVDLAYLFGSLAERGGGEDVDVAVLGEALDTQALRIRLQGELCTERLHLVNLREASLTVNFEVIRTGRILFKTDDEAENRFEGRVLQAFQDRAPARHRQKELLAERTRAWLSRST